MRAIRISLLTLLVMMWSLGAVAVVRAVTPAEALQLDGKNGTIEGVVTDVNITERGHAFINMGGVYPNHTFTAYVPAVIVPILGREYLESLRGKEIAVTGKIKLYKGKPEIVFNKKDQVVVKGAETPEKAPAKQQVRGGVPVSREAPDNDDRGGKFSNPWKIDQSPARGRVGFPGVL